METATTIRDKQIGAFFKALTELVNACTPAIKKAVAEYVAADRKPTVRAN